jgi:hypothetical protein
MPNPLDEANADQTSNTRFTLTMSKDSHERLGELAEYLDTSKAGVLRRSLKALDFLVKQADDDRKIVIKNSDGAEMEVSDLMF